MRRPWNRVDLPVYSVSSNANGNHNMHICTYVMGASMEPKRMAVGVYKGTKTLELVEKTNHFMLQLLAKDQYGLIKLLGQSSGHTIDKLNQLTKKDLLAEWKSFPVLKSALAYIELKTYSTMDAGDHIVYICDVKSFRNNLEGDALTLNLLRKKKIIRG